MLAVKIMRTCKFSAIVIDGGIPDLLTDFPSRISSTLNTSTPCIFLAKPHLVREIKKNFNPKLDDILLKPFKSEYLTRHVIGTLRPIHSSSQVKLDGMTLCIKGGTITVGGLTLKLPEKQMKVLHLLSTHAPRAVDKLLLAEVLGLQGSSTSEVDSAINPLIYRIRIKLRNLGGDVHVKTIRGCGYRVLTTKR